jgi:hypothetical protein
MYFQAQAREGPESNRKPWVGPDIRANGATNECHSKRRPKEGKSSGFFNSNIPEIGKSWSQRGEDTLMGRPQ